MPQITWFFNGNAITQNTDRSHIYGNGTLIINNPLVEDSGVYKCEAANYLGSISAIANVKVNGEFDKFIFNSTQRARLHSQYGVDAQMQIARNQIGLGAYF